MIIEIAIVGILFLCYEAFKGICHLIDLGYTKYYIWKMDREWKKKFKTPK